tara:strand:- start:1394 stop:1765 length:372 start_codon:yes stop_codon:yes gene_type:complete
LILDGVLVNFRLDYSNHVKGIAMQQQQKIGKSKDKRRVTIWNRAMIDAGFPIGQQINVSIRRGSVIIVPADDSRRKVSGVMNHGNRLPVIDLKETGSLDLSTLGNPGDSVTVTIARDRITVSR